MDSKESKLVKKLSLSAHVTAAVILPSKPVKRPILSAHVHDCFFGFADASKEEHFTMLKAKARIPVLRSIGLVMGAAAIYRAWHSDDWSHNPLGSILLDPGAPQSFVTLLIPLISNGTWRWLEPTVVTCSVLRFVSLSSWLLCDPASTLSVVQWWSGPLASMGSFICFSLFVAAANFMSNARFKYGLLSALAWMSMAPVIAHYSSTGLQAWPLVMSMMTLVSLHLLDERKARSIFLDLFYPTTESQSAATAAPTSDGDTKPYDDMRAGVPLEIGVGLSILHQLSGRGGSCELTLPVASVSGGATQEGDRGAAHIGLAGCVYDEQLRATQSDDNSNPYDDMSDAELQELIKRVRGCYGESLANFEATALPKYETVFLRIPDADPDDLDPDAKLRLKEQFEAAHPGYTVDEITFQRGSLLVGMRVRPLADAEAPVSRETTVRKLKDIKHSSWLAWLGLPADMDMSVRINIPTERRTRLLDRFPLAVTVPKSEEGVHTMAFPLLCSELLQGVAIKASLGEHILQCDVVREDAPPGSPPDAQGLITLQMMLPTDTLCVSCCWLVTVNVQNLSDHVIVGDRTVVLLDKALAVLEPELCPMRLVQAQDMPHVLKTLGVEQPSGPEIVYALGLWMQTLCALQQLADGAHGQPQDVIHVMSQQLADGAHRQPQDVRHVMISQQLVALWRSGNLLLTFLVGNGCKDSVKQVIDLLLNSPALRPFVRTSTQSQSTGEHAEDLADSSSFLDFMSGAHNSVGSSIMHIAVMSGSCDVVDEVIRWSDAYSLPCQWEAKDKHGMTPLHLAQLVNDGKMATFLLHKGDPVLAAAWRSGGERRGGGQRCGGSPEQFSQHLAKMTSRASSALNPRGGSSRTSCRSLTLPRQLRLACLAMSQPASTLPTTIMPTPRPASAGPLRSAVARDLSPPYPQPHTGHLPALTAHNCTSSVPPGRPRGAGVTNPSNTASCGPPGRPRCAGGPNPSSLVKFLCSGSMPLHRAHQVKRFITNRMRQISEVSELIASIIRQIPEVSGLIVERIKQLPEFLGLIVVSAMKISKVLFVLRRVILLAAFFCMACMWYAAMPYMLAISIVCDQVLMRKSSPVKRDFFKKCDQVLMRKSSKSVTKS